jgi:hypothetical protein
MAVTGFFADRKKKERTQMRPRFTGESSKRRLVYLFLMLFVAGTFCKLIFGRSDSDSNSDSKVIARGGGTTIIQGGTGATNGFTPILTKIAFHAEKEGGAVTGGFECLALAPEAMSGGGSGQFTVNAMYVTGQITRVELNGDSSATLTGTANITGLGAGKNVPFTFEVRKGGPGATSILKVDTLPAVVFNEILLEGAFDVRPVGHED